jgi:flagellar basal-body rod protein FlgB
MIDALFNQPNYVAAKRLLDVTAARMEAAASNLGNVETPGYRRVDLPRAFEKQLQEAVRSGDVQALRNLQPQLQPDPNAAAVRPDGNTVDLESEMVGMYRASMEHELETRLVTGRLLKLRLAITGRST